MGVRAVRYSVREGALVRAKPLSKGGRSEREDVSAFIRKIDR